MIRNPFFQRLQNIVFSKTRAGVFGVRWETGGNDHEMRMGSANSGKSSSISASHGWVEVADCAASGKMDTDQLRKITAVLDIVETVPPGDGVAYADLVHTLGKEYLLDRTVEKIDRWGSPLRWPAFLLGTPRPFSPTTLRYLATALWMRDCGLVSEGGEVVEIGVGFGGLAAMNGLVSKTRTKLVDLPPVEKLAARMLRELGLESAIMEATPVAEEFTVVSNYAFTELSSEVQDLYLEQWISHSSKGLILSNAEIFSKHIGGRNDAELLELISSAGFQPKLSKTSSLLSPSDLQCGNSVITWGTC